MVGPFSEPGFTQIAAVLAKPVTKDTRKKRAAKQLDLIKRQAIRYDWPTKSHITEEEAKEKCQNDLKQTSAALACKREGYIKEVDPEIIRVCVEDIKVRKVHFF